MVQRIALIALVAVVLAGLLVLSQLRSEPLRVSGFVEADEIRIGSRVGGRVARVHIQEGQAVQEDQPLIELEPFDLRQRQQQARAKLAASQAELARLEAGFRVEEIAQAKARYNRLKARVDRLVTGPRPQEIEAAKAQVQAALAQLELAQQNLDRITRILGKAASREEHERAVEQLKAAVATRTVQEKQLELLVEGTRKEEILEARAQLDEAQQAWQLAQNGYRREDIDQARAARDAAQAALEAIGTQLEELTIRAPIAGVVEAVELQKGDLVPAGAPVLSIMDIRKLWVRTYVPGSLQVEVNQQVRVTVDSLAGRQFTGRVTFKSRQAEFTPSNVQTPEERSRQVFRVKVTIEGETAGLWPGMTADVWLE